MLCKDFWDWSFLINDVNIAMKMAISYFAAVASKRTFRFFFTVSLFVVVVVVAIITISASNQNNGFMNLVDGSQENKTNGTPIVVSSTTTMTTISEEVVLGHNITEASKSIMCAWNPDDKDDECVHFLTNRVLSLHGDAKLKRWMIAGDSTMWRLYRKSPLQQRLGIRPCWKWGCQWNGMHSPDEFAEFLLGFNPNTNTTTTTTNYKWQPPNFDVRKEGPVGYGYHHPYRQDCSGCNAFMVYCWRNRTTPMSKFCTTNNTRSDFSVGGYVGIEFARDVEIQSSQFQTTQEHFANYLNQKWNAPYMIEQMGKPVCLIQSGIHDAAIPGITLSEYLDSVHFYLNLLQDQCQHIIWLGNTAPATNHWSQKISQTQIWNSAVVDLLATSLPEMTSFVDVFNASVKFEHKDNIHMNEEWYLRLGQMFTKVVTKLTQAT